MRFIRISERELRALRVVTERAWGDEFINEYSRFLAHGVALKAEMAPKLDGRTREMPK